MDQYATTMAEEDVDEGNETMSMAEEEPSQTHQDKDQGGLFLFQQMSQDSPFSGTPVAIPEETPAVFTRPKWRTNEYAVDTYQINVLNGDCSVHLMVQRTSEEANIDKRGWIENAILVDGGNDGHASGTTTAQTILESIEEIEKRYANRLLFDAWIITHWDNDHWCGALTMIENDLERSGDHRFRYFRYDQYHYPQTILYCPNWEFPDAHRLGFRSSYNQGGQTGTGTSHTARYGAPQQLQADTPVPGETMALQETFMTILGQLIARRTDPESTASSYLPIDASYLMVHWWQRKYFDLIHYRNFQQLERSLAFDYPDSASIFRQVYHLVGIIKSPSDTWYVDLRVGRGSSQTRMAVCIAKSGPGSLLGIDFFTGHRLLPVLDSQIRDSLHNLNSISTVVEQSKASFLVAEMRKVHPSEKPMFLCIAAAGFHLGARLDRRQLKAAVQGHVGPGETWKNLSSIVSVLSCHGNAHLSLYWGGDAITMLEDSIVNARFFDGTTVKVMKLSHHGSRGSNSAKLIEKLRPKRCIVSAGKVVNYKHPSSDTILRLQKFWEKNPGPKENNFLVSTRWPEWFHLPIQSVGEADEDVDLMIGDGLMQTENGSKRGAQRKKPTDDLSNWSQIAALQMHSINDNVNLKKSSDGPYQTQNGLDCGIENTQIRYILIESGTDHEDRQIDGHVEIFAQRGDFPLPQYGQKQPSKSKSKPIPGHKKAGKARSKVEEVAEIEALTKKLQIGPGIEGRGRPEQPGPTNPDLAEQSDFARGDLRSGDALPGLSSLYEYDWSSTAWLNFDQHKF